jgi:hypothetical protein
LIPQEQFVAIANDILAAMALIFGQQCHRDPSRLIFAEQLCRRAATGFAFVIDVAQRLTVCSRTMKQFGVTSADQGGGKRRSVTAFCHIVMPVARYFDHGGDDAMRIADYIAIGFLIACMLFAAAKAIPRRGS